MKGAEKDAENLRHKQHMAKRVRTLAAELAQANKQIDAMKSACKGYADTVIRVAGERDDACRKIDAMRDLEKRLNEEDAVNQKLYAQYCDASSRRESVERDFCAAEARIESLHADLRTRTEERDAAQLSARQYAETRRLADDLQAELAAAKIALAEMTEESQQWANNARDAVLEVGRVRGQLESLASLTMKNGSAAVALAEIVLAESKPCAP